MLFVELALIRWVTANNVFVTKATNFVLLASFLGIGIGFLNARTKRDYLRWTPVALLLLVSFVLAFPVILQTLNGPHPFQGLHGTPALPQPVSLGVVFLLVTGVMAGLGQGTARLFVRFRPLRAYRLDILGSLAGIAAFTGLSFLDQPPGTWGVIACAGLLVLLAPKIRWWQILAVASVATMLLLESFAPAQEWSPYNKLVYNQVHGADRGAVRVREQHPLPGGPFAGPDAQAEGVLLLPLPARPQGVAGQRPDHRVRDGQRRGRRAVRGRQARRHGGDRPVAGVAGQEPTPTTPTPAPG